MPSDPRKALGKCPSIGIKGSSFAGTIDAAATNEFGQWPPATISNVEAGVLTLMPTYTETVSMGNGWFDAGDTTPGVTTVAGCTYPAAWTALILPALRELSFGVFSCMDQVFTCRIIAV
jgi:glucan 1,3-beta-glucosidase